MLKLIKLLDAAKSKMCYYAPGPGILDLGYI
jgi:hypothetical protein